MAWRSGGLRVEGSGLRVESLVLHPHGLRLDVFTQGSVINAQEVSLPLEGFLCQALMELL